MRVIHVVVAMAVTLGASCAPPSPSDEEPTGKAGAAITSPPVLLGSNATGNVRAAATGTMGLVAWRTATGIDAQRVDSSGAAVGSVLSFTTNDPWSTSLAVAGGNGTFAVVTTWQTGFARRPCARRIAADGTLIDATWVIDDLGLDFADDVPAVGAAFNGSDFVLDWPYSACWSWPDHCTGYVRSATVATSGPLVFGPGGGLFAPGFPYQRTAAGALACSGPTCAHYYWVDECEGPNCFNSAPAGVYRMLAGTIQFLGADDLSQGIVASDSMFLAFSHPPPGDLAAQRLDLVGNPIGGLITPPAAPATAAAATFDGMDFALAWISGGDVQANWVSPAGAVALAVADPAVVTPGTETALSLASFGGGLSLLATLNGSDVEARILDQGCGGCDDGEACTIESCDVPTLTCVHTPAPDWKPCPTGVCQSGLCVVAPLGAPCGAAANCLSGFCSDGVCCTTACDAGPCDACSVAAGASVDGTCDLLTGNACEDGNACSQDDSCLAGVCVGGPLVVCPAPDPCHLATCDAATGVCSSPAGPDGSPCNDGNPCSQGDACQAGVCAGGGPVVCPSAGVCYEAGVCDPADGTCSYHGKPDGTPCPGGLCFGDACIEGLSSGSDTGGAAGGSTTSNTTAGTGGSGAGGAGEEPGPPGGCSGCRWGTGTSPREGPSASRSGCSSSLDAERESRDGSRIARTIAWRPSTSGVAPHLTAPGIFVRTSGESAQRA